MGLKKVDYIDQETVITAENLNDIQDAIIELQNGETGGGIGADGKSAYEIAVEHGFEGTEEEWLASLKGEKGETGETGETGATGEKGETGNSGVYVGSGEMPEGYNVQIDPNGEAITIEELAQSVANLIEDNPVPTEIATEEEMTALLDTAEIGSVYKYTGETTDTYENGALYVVQESE